MKWFRDGMLTGAVRVVNPDQTTVLDTLRVLDYPNDYVPVYPRESYDRNGTTAVHYRLATRHI